MKFIEILADRNASTDEVIMIHEVLVEIGDKVSVGDLLCIAEGSKSLFDIESPVAGNITDIFVASKMNIAVGETIIRIQTN